MAPSHSRQLLVWSLPTIAALLSYLWYKRKRIGARSDPGGTNKTEAIIEVTVKETEPINMKDEGRQTASAEKKFSRSLSGVETEPIDIIIPRELRSVKSNPMHISDDELDEHIEKIKSMKNSNDIYTISKQTDQPIKSPNDVTPLKAVSNNSKNTNSTSKTSNLKYSESKNIDSKNSDSKNCDSKISDSKNNNSSKINSTKAINNANNNSKNTNNNSENTNSVEANSNYKNSAETAKHTSKYMSNKTSTNVNDPNNLSSNTSDDASNNSSLKKKMNAKSNRKSLSKKNQINEINGQTKINGEAQINGQAKRNDKAPLREKNSANGHREAPMKKDVAQQLKCSKAIVTPSTSNLNIDSKEFTPRSYEEVKQLETEFIPISSDQVKSSAPSTPHHNLPRQRNEVSNDERDSANHSPVDVMLASPSLSNISDNHSEGSSDSGKGCSEVATSPSRTPAANDLQEDADANLPPTIYDFIVPQEFVGKLIGKKGCTINEVKAKSGTHILVKQHPNNRKVKLCVIEGSSNNIEKALSLIREKFPLRKYPRVTMEQCYLAIPAIQLNPDALYLRLVEGIDNDTIVSCMVKPNYLFLQQHTHPTYMSLNAITETMNAEYSSPDSPKLHCPVPENSVCAGFSVNQWFRVLILQNNVEDKQAYVTFLDYGGYAIMNYSDLRQIRAEYLRIPFQAQGAILAGIRAVGGTDEWHSNAFKAVTKITFNRACVTQITGFTEWGEPLINLYVMQADKTCTFLNDELVARGYAEYANHEYNNPQWLYCQMEGAYQIPENSDEIYQSENSQEADVDHNHLTENGVEGTNDGIFFHEHVPVSSASVEEHIEYIPVEEHLKEHTPVAGHFEGQTPVIGHLEGHSPVVSHIEGHTPVDGSIPVIIGGVPVQDGVVV